MFSLDSEVKLYALSGREQAFPSGRAGLREQRNNAKMEFNNVVMAKWLPNQTAGTET